MRAIIWAAVSSKPQLKGDSLEAQTRDAKAVCERFEWEVVATLRIPGASRDFIFFQDAEGEVRAYREFHRLCERKLGDVLVCRGRDRLGRTDALIAQVEALAREAGMQIYSLAMPTAIIEPERAAEDRGILYAAAIERASAEAEMMELRRRHRMGMRARIRQGLHPSNLPFGYKDDGTNQVARQVPHECQTIRKMADLYLAGWGFDRIAAYLNDHAIASPRSVPWRAAMVRKILHNPFYGGWVRWGDTIAEGKHEAIFSPPEWAALRAERQRRQRTRGKAAHPYTGLVRCVVCGYSMAANTSTYYGSDGERHRYHYYRCMEGNRRGLQRRGEPHHTMVRVEAIREGILRKAEEIADPEALEHILTDRTEKERADLERLKAELGKAKSRLGSEIARLLEAHTRWQSIGAKEFDEAMTEAAKRSKKLDSRLLEVTIALEELPSPEIRREQLRSLATDIESILDSSQIQEANAWLSKRIAGIWCDGREVKRVELC